jgi:hypothetical protein
MGKIYDSRARGVSYVRFEDFTAVTMKNAVTWDVNAMWLLYEPTFRRNVSPSSPSSGSQELES